MSEAIVPAADATPAVDYSAEQIEVIKKYIAPGCPETELQFLVERSRKSGMNVIAGECHFVPALSWDNEARTYVKKWSIQTAIEFYRKRGIGTGLIDWYDSQSFFVKRTQNGISEHRWRDIPSVGYPPNPHFARARIKRKDMSEPIVHEAYWTEYVKTGKNGEPKSTWKKMPGLMLEKVAEAGCWRKCVPAFHGVYTQDEMPESIGTLPQGAGKTREEGISAAMRRRIETGLADAGTLDDVEAVLDVENHSNLTKQDLTAVLEAKAAAMNAVEQKGTDNANAAVAPPAKKRGRPPKSKKETPPASDAFAGQSESEFVSTLIPELLQCQTADGLNAWFNAHMTQMKSLSEQNNTHVKNIYQRRMSELSTAENNEKTPEAPPAEPAKQAAPEEAKNPEAVSPEPKQAEPTPDLAETITEKEREAREQEKKKKDTRKKNFESSRFPITDAALRLMMKICYTVEDQSGKPFIGDHNECYAFLSFLFKEGDVKRIQMKDATRFIAKFNNFANPQELLDLYCRFRNEKYAREAEEAKEATDSAP